MVTSHGSERVYYDNSKHQNESNNTDLTYDGFSHGWMSRK